VACLESDEAGEDAAVEVVEEQGGVAGVVPVEAALPAFGFVAQQGAKLRSGEVAQIKDFELREVTRRMTQRRSTSALSVLLCLRFQLWRF
jgi:hypothetical protein